MLNHWDGPGNEITAQLVNAGVFMPKSNQTTDVT